VRTEDEIKADVDPKRPFSNGTEYEIWASSHCYECVNEDFGSTDSYCPILSVALLDGWPKEWTRQLHKWEIGDASGEYEVVDTCTEFVQRPDWPGDDDPDDGPDPDPGPPPVVEGQLDLIDAYLDTAIGELQKAPVASS
jgi:hypothetical protein